MAGIGELSVSITARTEKAMRNIKSFRNSVNNLPSSISKAATSMAGLATSAAGLVGVGAIGYEIKQAFSRIDDLAKTADKIGIATEKLTALRFAAEETGVASKTTDMALQRMVRRISEASKGAGEAKDAIAELGLSAASLAQLSPDRQFAEIADAMNKVGNQSDRVRLAMRLFDSEGVSLVNTLRLGKQGLEAYEEEARKLGITVNRFDAAQVEKANDAFGRIGKSVEGITNRLAIGLAPVIEGVSMQFVEMSKSGVASNEAVSASIQKSAVYLAKVGDGLELYIRLWYQGRAAVTEWGAAAAGTMRWAANNVAKLLNTFHSSLRNLMAVAGFQNRFIDKMIDDAIKVDPNQWDVTLAEEMEKQAEQMRRAADKMWSQPLPSQKVNGWFEQLNGKIDEARENFNSGVGAKGAGFLPDESYITSFFDKLDSLMNPPKPDDLVPKQFQSQVNNVGKGLGNLFAGATGMLRNAGLAFADAVATKPLRIEMPETAQRGSREEFQLLRKIQNESTNMAMKQAQRQTTAQVNIQQGVERLIGLFVDSGGKIDRVITAIENLNLGESV